MTLANEVSEGGYRVCSKHVDLGTEWDEMLEGELGDMIAAEEKNTLHGFLMKMDYFYIKSATIVSCEEECLRISMGKVLGNARSLGNSAHFRANPPLLLIKQRFLLFLFSYCWTFHKCQSRPAPPQQRTRTYLPS